MAAVQTVSPTSIRSPQGRSFLPNCILPCLASRESHSSPLFTQPPMRRMRICFTDVFFCFLCVFLFFFVRHKNTRQPFSGTAERIFMKLLPNDSAENVVSNVVRKWGLGPQLIFLGLKTTHCALGGDAWRVSQN